MINRETGGGRTTATWVCPTTSPSSNCDRFNPSSSGLYCRRMQTPEEPRHCFDDMGEIRTHFECRPRNCCMEYEIGADESVSTAVVSAVSAVEGRAPRSLRPLAEILDPDALNALFDSCGDGTPRAGGRLTFVYSKCCVTVDNGEYLTLHPIDPRISEERGPNVIDSGIQ